MIDAFGGPDTTRGNTGPFWVGSALAIFSALITLFMIRPLTADGMTREDGEFRAYLEAHGWDTSQMGNGESVEDLVGEKVSAREGSFGSDEKRL